MMAERKPLVSIVTVNFNRKQLTKKCLDSLYAVDYPKNKLQIIVVDNCSQDGSVGFIKNTYKRVTLLANKNNNYCQACNLGIQRSTGKYIVLLNNDVKVNKTWLSELVKAMEADSSIGAATCKLLKPDGTIQNAGLYELPNFYWDERGAGGKAEEYDSLVEVEAISGACALYRSSALKQVGLLDEDFVMYGEDVDMSFRLKEKGWKLTYVPHSVGYHKMHGSGNEKLSRDYIEKNRLIFIAKHFPLLLTRSLVGNNYFMVSKDDPECGKLLDVLPRIFIKLETHHNRQVISAITNDLFAELKRILSGENKKLEELLRDHHNDLVYTKGERDRLKVEDESHRKKLADLSSQLELASKALGNYKNEITNLSEMHKKNLDAIAVLSDNLKGSLELVSQKDNAILEKQQKLYELSRRFDMTSEELKQYQDKTRVFAQQLQESIESGHSKDSTIQEKARQIEAFSRRIALSQDELQGAKEEVAQLSQKLQESIEFGRSKDSTIQEKAKQIEAFSRRIALAHDELQGAKEEVAQLSQKLQENLDSELFKNAEILQKDEQIGQFSRDIDCLKNELKDSLESGINKDSAIQEKAKQIEDLCKRIAEAQEELNNYKEEISLLTRKLQESLDSGLHKDTFILEKEKQYQQLVQETIFLKHELANHQEEISQLNNTLKETFDCGLVKDSIIQEKAGQVEALSRQLVSLQDETQLLTQKLQESLDTGLMKDTELVSRGEEIRELFEEITRLNTNLKETFDCGLVKDSIIQEKVEQLEALSEQLVGLLEETRLLTQKLQESLDSGLLKDSELVSGREQIGKLSEEISRLNTNLKETFDCGLVKDSIIQEKAEQVEALSRQLVGLQEEMHLLTQQLQESLGSGLLKDAELMSRSEQIGKLSEEIGRLQNELSDRQEAISRLSYNLKESLDSGLLKDSELMSRSEQIGKLSEEISRLSNNLKESLDSGLLKDSELMSRSEQIGKLSEEIGRLQNELSNRQQEISRLSNNLKESLDSGLLKDSELMSRSEQIGKFSEEIGRLQNELSNHQQEIVRLSNTLKESLDSGLLKDGLLLEKTLQLETISKELGKVREELSSIYQSEGFRFVLKPLWKIIWHTRRVLKALLHRVNSIFWLFIGLLLTPFILLQALLLASEGIAEITFGKLSVLFRRKRSVVSFENLSVSVVIPNWNGIDLLRQCLGSIYEIEEFKTGKHEVLVVDDASKYSIAKCIKDEFPKVRVIRNLLNRGFGRTCNRGVKEAKGELIVLLNNDIMVSPDFLAPLKEHFRDAEVFSVAPKLYYWDKKTFNYGMHMGRFENGYLSLWNEAETGNGDKISQTAPTVFAVGGAMVFRKKDFFWLGGFDDIYRPNCWEDIDISYRAQKRGLKVLYEPKSLVYHKGAATLNYIRHKEIKNELLFMWKNLTDVGMLLSHINALPKFFYHGRHSSRITFLKGYFWAFDHLPWALAHKFREARYRKISDKKILDKCMLYYRNFRRNNYVHRNRKSLLLVTPFMLYPLNCGGKLRIYNFCKRLAQGYDITLLSLIHDEKEREYIPALKNVFKEVHVVHDKTPSPELFFPERYKYSYSSHFIDKLKEIQDTTPLDLVQIESNELLYLSKYIKHIPVVYTEHDISMISYTSSYYKNDSFGPLSGFRDYLQRVYYHNLAYRYIDKAITLSKHDYWLVRAFSPSTPLSLISTGVDLEHFAFTEKAGKSKDLIFVGHYPHYPNEEAAVYFSRKIFPLIKRRIPDARLKLVGSNPTEPVKRLAEIGGVDVIGTVEDVMPHFRGAAIFVNAFKRSAGIKGKVLEAMATGTPVVCTTLGAGGIDARNGESIFFADDSVSFADHVIRLMEDNELYRKLARNARLLVEKQYDWDKLAAKHDQVYAEIMGTEPALPQVIKDKAAVFSLEKTERPAVAVPASIVVSEPIVEDIIAKVDQIIEGSLNRYHAVQEKAIVSKDPEELHIELTHLCNSKCMTCDIWDIYERNHKTTADELSLEEIQKLIAESSRVKNVRTVVLSGGEPFLRPDLVRICSLIGTYLPNAAVIILTNATNTETVISKTKEILKISKIHSLSIGSSLDGIGLAYDMMRGLASGFTRFVKTVERFKSELPEIPFSTTFVLTPFNSDQLLPCWEFADKFGLDFFAQFGVPKEARKKEVFQWQEEDYIRIQGQIRLIIDRIISKSADKNRFHASLDRVSDKINLLTKIYYWAHLVDFQRTGKRFAYECDAGTKFAMSDAYGSMFFCPILKEKTIGNIRQSPLDQLWSSPEADSVRDFIGSHKCSCWLVCTVFPIVGEALARFGDAVAKSLTDGEKEVALLQRDIREAITQHMDNVDTFSDNKNLLSSVTENLDNLSLNDLEFQEKKCMLSSTPRGVTIGTNYRCNASCIFCLGGDYKPFSLELYKDYFEPRLGYMMKRSEYISLCGMGELLLIPEANQFLAYLNKRIPEKNKILTTNGLPLTDPKIIEQVTASRYSVQISLHASNAALHEHLTGIKGGFDRITQQIKILAAKRPDRQMPYIVVISVLNTMNIEDLPKLVELAAGLGADAVHCNYLTIYKEAHLKLSCFFNQEITNCMLKLAEEAARKHRINLVLPPLFSAVSAPCSVCNDPWKNIYVDTEGKVLPCCYSGTHFGDMNKKDALAIWNNELFQQIRKDLGSGTPLSMCKYCLNSKQSNVNNFVSHVSFRPDVQKLILNNN